MRKSQIMRGNNTIFCVSFKHIPFWHFSALHILDNLKNSNFVKLTKVNVSPQDDSDLSCATSSNKLVNLALISGRNLHLSTLDITICLSGQMSLAALS